ncbi:hypothetical protein VV867_00770 [Pseudomonas sp. JH-2]|uniref:hypothetical protein n=1 Tax=Pseudomonas sp. JH-2 TaxID=3114998 RepID=UPI002E27375A|nr:hypothetical protein [Pseudomonas sp. JH-2]
MPDLLLEVLFHSLCYPVGWPVVKLFTLGRYPRRHTYMSGEYDAEWTAAIGLAVLVIAMMAALRQFALH